MILSNQEHNLYLQIMQHQAILLIDISKHYKIYYSQNRINMLWKKIALETSKAINFISRFDNTVFFLGQLHKLKDFNNKLMQVKNIKLAKTVVIILLKLSILQQ
ncbi:unnamed protein product [Paramecium octaurelia]|uniref:Uncharacterized protein n=1 Tax=Paramecium octaurelia TaxID=43137 RepID=A0A8S1WUN6_PAROT|nr:unnamed protein product [Paramecium octaurelia]